MLASALEIDDIPTAREEQQYSFRVKTSSFASACIKALDMRRQSGVYIKMNAYLITRWKCCLQPQFLQDIQDKLLRARVGAFLFPNGQTDVYHMCT